jgi:hypothetical protein
MGVQHGRPIDASPVVLTIAGMLRNLNATVQPTS